MGPWGDDLIILGSFKVADIFTEDSESPMNMGPYRDKVRPDLSRFCEVLRDTARNLGDAGIQTPSITKLFLQGPSVTGTTVKPLEPRIAVDKNAGKAFH